MLTMTTKGDKLAAFCTAQRLTYDHLLSMMARYNLCPGVCVNPDCNFTCEEIESDQEQGYCDSCGNQTVISVLRLADLI